MVPLIARETLSLQRYPAMSLSVNIDGE